MGPFQWLAHKLLGRDYVMVDGKVLWVRVDGEGMPYVLRKGDYSVSDFCLKRSLGYNVRWLTCSPNKYKTWVD